MLAKRIIPCLDVDNGRVVKGKNFQGIQDVADPVELAKQYCRSEADELVFYDITATTENRNIWFDLVKRLAAEVTIPFTVGGGLRSLDDIHQVLQAGADKVSLNSAAVRNPSLLEEAAAEFGSSCIVLAMDVGKKESGWTVFLNGGKTNTGIHAIDWAKRSEKLGVGEIVINSIDKDGVKSGFQLELTTAIAETVSIPVVASGGAGEMSHFSKVLQEGKADAALAASVFHYGDIEIPMLKQYLRNNGVTVRREHS